MLFETMSNLLDSLFELAFQQCNVEEEKEVLLEDYISFLARLREIEASSFEGIPEDSRPSLSDKQKPC
jgi:hypothetical protein